MFALSPEDLEKNKRKNKKSTPYCYNKNIPGLANSTFQARDLNGAAISHGQQL